MKKVLLAIILILIPIVFTFWLGHYFFGGYPKEGIMNLPTLDYIQLFFLLVGFYLSFQFSKKSLKKGIFLGIVGVMIGYIIGAIGEGDIFFHLLGLIYFIPLFLIFWLYTYLSKLFWKA